HSSFLVYPTGNYTRIVIIPDLTTKSVYLEEYLSARLNPYYKTIHREQAIFFCAGLLQISYQAIEQNETYPKI
ncbi:MAG: hypothetical protein ABW094_18830, partial [Candidatus Thiodiazotropha sp.]